MHKINEQVWFDLEPYLDMETFITFEDKIIYNIAKNAETIKPSTTSKNTLYNQTAKSFREEENLNKEKYPEFNNLQRDWITQLTSSGLGYHLLLNGIRNYPQGYSLKHTREGMFDYPHKEDFRFIFDWLEQQSIFKEYGRSTFWIAKANEKTALHTDYGDITSTKKDMFIWLTGRNRKKLLQYDNDLNITIPSTTRAGIFNNCNWHCGLGHETMMAWSFRVDGIFTDEFMEKTGLDSYFKA